MRITITGAPNSYVQPTRNPDSMHVNPAHVISTWRDEDGDYGLMLDGFGSIWGDCTHESYVVPNVYHIDEKSHKRIVAWLEAQHGGNEPKEESMTCGKASEKANESAQGTNDLLERCYERYVDDTRANSLTPPVGLEAFERDIYHDTRRMADLLSDDDQLTTLWTRWLAENAREWLVKLPVMPNANLIVTATSADEARRLVTLLLWGDEIRIEEHDPTRGDDDALRIDVTSRAYATTVRDAYKTKLNERYGAPLDEG